MNSNAHLERPGPREPLPVNPNHPDQSYDAIVRAAEMPRQPRVITPAPIPATTEELFEALKQRGLNLEQLQNAVVELQDENAKLKRLLIAAKPVEVQEAEVISTTDPDAL